MGDKGMVVEVEGTHKEEDMDIQVVVAGVVEEVEVEVVEEAVAA